MNTFFIKQRTVVLGLFFVLGCLSLGLTIGNSLLKMKSLERTVTVKGLAEKDVPADIVIWTLSTVNASHNLNNIYSDINKDTLIITNYLIKQGVSLDEITVGAPDLLDKLAQNYVETGVEFRYSATQNITVYSTNIDLIRTIYSQSSELGKYGITITGNSRYDMPIEYIFTNLNSIKPQMIQEATQQAKEVALKFAEDSQSKVGKIKNASQGQFTINDRDRNNPHIKRVRVVSTVEYYLSD